MVTLANAEQPQVKRAPRAAYGVTLAELAGEGVPVVAVDADLTGSTTTAKFAKAGYATSRSPAASPCSAPVVPMIRSATPCAIPI